MAKMLALNSGADDAWLVESGKVTEGSASNAHIVTNEGVLVTRHLGTEILHGITRRAVLRLAAESDIRIEERAFSVEEAYEASEAFITSASTLLLPVVRIDGRIIGDGRPGPVAARLRELYIEDALSRAD